jgi:hypothetical protein
MAEVVGAEKVFNYISKYHFRKIKLSKGSDVVYTDSVKANGEEAILLDRFQNWVSDFIEPDNYREYKLELFGTNKEEAEVRQLTPVIKISVMFNQKDYTPARAFSGVNSSSNVDFKEYTALAVENAKLNAQLSRLEEKLNDLVTEADVEEEATPSVSERIGAVLLDRADDIISVLLMKLGGALTPVTPQAPISGVDSSNHISKEAIEKAGDEWWEDNLIDLGYEFKDINPDILSDLQKLLNLAKTNKPLFDMLIKQLRSM